TLGGAYFLYQKRKSAAAAASNLSGATTTTGSAGAAPTADNSALGQQPSVVPYYLTGNSGQSQGSPGNYYFHGQGNSGGLPNPTPTSNGGGSSTALPSPLDTNPIIPATPTQPAPTPAPAAPAPSPTVMSNNIPSDLLARIQANGEHIIGSLNSPNGGVWYLGSKGGVFAINAPFLGAPYGQPYWGTRTPLSIAPNGQGYTVVDIAGERYNYS
ncbi:MAG: hypothetical protein ACREMY_00900, partial [bacterium]